jgi:DNA-binding NarL/FixJ family response regulator
MTGHPAPARPRRRILIVDDIPQVRQALRLLLDLSSRVEVVGEAANGLEAVLQAEALLPDAILMDLEMPALDGFEAARRIKARRPGCRVIALSVHSYPLARQKAAQAGMDGFVEKGAPLAEILRLIEAGEN